MTVNSFSKKVNEVTCFLIGVFAFFFVQAESLTDDEIREFATHMEHQHGIKATQVTDILRYAMVQPNVLEKMTKPAEGLPWYRYREIFLTENRIQGGLDFWRVHEKKLLKAEQLYGVPPEIITAIIGVETFYGKRAGNNVVLDSLVTLGFRYPRRSKFFLSELEHFFLLTHHEGLDPFRIKGSYAGAMGIPQFMPSSYRVYAVDFNGDNVRDLIGSVSDSIGSVGNYLNQHGWARGESIAFPATLEDSNVEEFLKQGIKPITAVEKMRSRGIKISEDVSDNSKAALMQFQLPDGLVYWIGLNNFYAITRYNHSSLYGMAVYQLSRVIEKRYKE